MYEIKLMNEIYDQDIADLVRRQQFYGQTELFFDDLPLEHILYGERAEGPTQASIFREADVMVQEIIEVWSTGDMEKTIQKASQLPFDQMMPSLHACSKMREVLRSIVPNYPRPILGLDISALGPVLEALRQRAADLGVELLKLKYDELLYRWFEHMGRYGEAREILKGIIPLVAKRGDRAYLAVMINNYAFEFLLQKRWRYAIPLFGAAAKLFRDIDIGEYANARSNQLFCELESSHFGFNETTVEELETLADILEIEDSWHKRKPIMLLARIYELKGKMESAFELAKKALRPPVNRNSWYYKEDIEFVKRMRSLIAKRKV